MIQKILVLYLLGISGLIAQNCTNKVENISLIQSTQENYWWELQDVFFTGTNLTYELNDTQYFQIVQPFSSSDNQKPYAKQLSVIQAKPLTLQKGTWLNTYAILSVNSTNDENYVQWSFGNPFQGLQSPQFNQITLLKESQKCFGLDFINSTEVVVDCFDSTTDENSFWFVNKDTATKIDGTNTNKYTEIQERFIQVYYNQSQNYDELQFGNYTLIYRGTPTSGLPANFINQSVLEVFEYTDGKLNLISTLDSELISNILGLDKYEFNLVQFKINQALGQVYILDALNKVIIVLKLQDGGWLLVDQITTDINPIAFDLRYQVNPDFSSSLNVIVLYSNKYENYLLVNGKFQVQVVNTDINLTEVGVFSISSEFLIIQNIAANNITIYLIESGEILTESKSTQQQWLVNPDYNRLISFTDEYSQAWSFSEGELQYISQDEVTNSSIAYINLTANSIINTQSISCEVIIKLQVYNNNDTQLVRLTSESPLQLPEFITQKTQINAQNKISGPNQQYSGGEAGASIIVQSLVLQQLNIIDTPNYPEADNIVFGDTLPNQNDPNVFYQILQTANNYIRILSCEIEYYSANTECKKHGEIEIDQSINSKAYYAFTEYFAFSIITLNSPYEIMLSSCYGGNCDHAFNWTYPTEKGQEITSFTYLQKQIWVVRAGIQEIDIYQSGYPFNKIYTINSAVIKSLGYTGTWQPQSILSNNDENQSTVFIDNNDDLILANYVAQLNLLAQIPYSLKNPQVSLAIASDTFFIAETNGTTSSLKEYRYITYDDLVDIKLQKQVNLLWYEFQTPLQADFSAENGYFFIRALDTQQDVTVLLVFQPNVSQRDVLYQVISLETLIQPTTSIIFSPSGHENMFIYLNTGSSQSSWSFLTYPSLMLIPAGQPDELVTRNVPLPLRISNFASSNSFTYLDEAILFNTGSNIQFNDEALENQVIKAFQLRKSNAATQIPIQSNWYSGTVLYFEIECEDCDDKLIQIQNVVDEQDLIQPLYAVNDFAQLNENNLLAQSDTALWILSEQGNLTKILDYNIDQDTSCSLMQIGDGGSNIVSLCENSTSYYIHITVCLSVDSCRDFDTLPLPNVSSVLDFAIIDTDNAINLVILNDYTNKSTSSESNIMTFAITFDELGNGTVQTLQVLDTTTLGFTSPSSMTYFSYQGSDKLTYYKFLFLDSIKGIFGYDGSVQQGLLNIKQSSQQILDLSSFLGDKYFISKTTQFLQIKTYNQSQNGDQLNSSIILTTTNVAHFGLVIVMDTSTAGSAQWKTASVNFQLNRYGGAQTANQLVIYDGQIIIPYKSNRSPILITLCYYEIPKNQVNANVLNILGGTEYFVNNNEQLEYLPFIIAQTQTQQYILFTSTGSYYNLNNQAGYPRVVVSNTNQVQPQKIKLSAYNEQVVEKQEAQTILSFNFCNCSTLVQNLSLILATNENQWWGLKDVFFTGFNLSYSLNDTTQKYFGIIPQILAVDNGKIYKTQANVVQAVPLTQSINGAWLSSFAFLDYSSTTGSNLFWAFGNTIDGLQSPAFDTVTPVVNNSQQCFGLDFINSSTIVVDCFNTLTNTNYFQFVTADSKLEVNGTNTYGYTEVTYRQIQVVQDEGILDEESVLNTYIYRGTPTYGTSNRLAGDSVVEIFQIINDNEISILNSLDAPKLGQILSKKDYLFNLVGFKVLNNGQLYVLDESGYLYSLKLNATSNQFVLQAEIDLEDQKPYGFDVNQFINQDGTSVTNIVVLFNNYFVIYEWNDISTVPLKVKETLTNEIISQYPGPTIKISQEYIILQNAQTSTITIYTIDQDDILTQATVSAQYWLVNPYQSNIIQLTDLSAKTWTFDQGQLMYNSVQTEKKSSTAVQIDATSISNSLGVIETQTCSVVLEFKVYDHKSIELVEIDIETPIDVPEFIAQEYFSQVTTQISGPNQQYSAISKDVNIQSLVLNQLNIDTVGVKYPNVNDILFVENIVIDLPPTLYQIIQTANKKIIILQCDLNEIFISTECKEIGNIEIDDQIEQKAFTAWSYYNFIVVATLNNPYALQIIDCYMNVCKTFETISEANLPGNEFTAFSYQNSQLWIVLGNKKRIDVYNNGEYFELALSIDQSMVSGQGLTEPWAPVNIFGSRYFNQNIVFIDNSISLIVASFNIQLSLLDQIKYNSINPSVAVAVAANTFFIAETDGQNSYLYEYHFDKTSNIKLQKQLYLNWFIFQTPLQTDVSAENGNFFITAYDTINKNTVILVYTPNTSQRDALYQVIPTGSNGNATLIMAAAGDKTSIIYLNNGTQQSTWSLQNKGYQQVAVVPQNIDELVSTSKITFQVSNFQSGDILSSSIQITTFNTQSNINFNDELFNTQANKAFALKRTLPSKNISLNSTWYFGQVLYFEIECEDCDDGLVQIQNVVDEQKLAQPLFAVNDFLQLNENDLLAQSNQALWLLSEQGNLTKLLDYKINQDTSCSLMQIGYGGSNIVSLCENSTSFYIHITECLSVDSCRDFDILPLPNVTCVLDFAIIETDEGISLLILNDYTNKSSSSESSIMTFAITFDELGNGTLQTLQILDTTTIGFTSPSSMTYFSYQGSDKQTYYKFLFLDSINGIFGYDGSIVKGKLSLNPVNTNKLNLTQYLGSQGQYLSKVTKFLSIKQYQSNVTAQKIDVQLIVSTSNVAQFGLTINFDGSIEGIAPILSYSIDFVLNRYGAAQALNQLTIYNNQVIIPYESLAYPQTVTLCFYSIPLKVSFGQIPIINILGGAEIFVQSKIQIYYLPNIISTTSSGQNVLFTRYSSFYNLNDPIQYPRVVITNTTKLNSQQIKLIAYNEQIRYSAEVQTVLNFVLTDCQTNINSLNLILATNENQWWGLQDVFFTGYNLSYSINDTSDTTHFKIIDTLLSLDKSVNYKQPANIVQVVALQQENKEIWIYDFALLDYSAENGSNLFWAFGNTIDGLQSPAFDTVTPVVNNSQQCFGLDYINSSTIVVDCFNTLTNTNYFQFVTADSILEVNGTNTYGYTEVTYRQIQVVQSVQQQVLNTYIYRGTPSYGTSNIFEGYSVIEIFNINDQYNISLSHILDISQLRVLVKGIENFDLVQFKVLDDILYVLDQNGYVYKLGWDNDQWQLYDTIQLDEQPYGFDVTYEINQYDGKSYNIVILFTNRFDLYNWPGLYGKAKFVLSYSSGISISTYPAPVIAFSQQYILLQDSVQNLITIFELNKENIVKQSQSFSENIYWLVNPFYHEIISLTSSSAQAWSFSKGFLQFVSQESVTNDSSVIINIQAQSTFNSPFGDETETCQVPIQLSVYDNSNPVIVKTSNQTDPLLLPEFIAVNYETTLSDQYSGPNRQYKPDVSSKALQINSLSLAQIDLSKTSIPSASDIIFADVIAAGYPSTVVYQIFQTTNNQVLFFQCDTSLNKASCISMGYINITTEIQDKAFVAYNFYNYVFVGVLRTPYNISMYTCDYAFKCENDFNLGFDSSDKNNAITSFVYQQQYLWVVQSGLNIVSIYKNEYIDFSLQLIIDADLVKQQGYQDVWNPQAIYCNRNYDINTVFIDNKINLIIADFNGQLTLLDQIKYDLSNPQVKVGVAQTTFFIAESDGVQSLLHEYDYSDQHDIRFQKNHYLFNYTFTSKLIAELSPLNGYFLIGAYNNQIQQSAVLVFSPNKSQRDALFYLIPTGKISDTSIISSSGDKNLYIYLNIEGKQSLWYMQTTPLIEFLPLDNDELVVQNIPFSINMINSFTSQSDVIYQNQTTVFNTKSNIIFNDETFSKSAAASFQILQSSSTTNIQIEPEWFSGQILKYEIDCNNCTGDNPAIKIQNILNPKYLEYNLEDIIDFAYDAKGALYAQSATNLWLIKNNKEKESLLNYSLNSSATCSLIRTGDNGTILSLCSDYQQGLFIHVTECLSYGSCLDKGILNLYNLTSVINYAVLENDEAINLVILNDDQNSTDNNQSNIMIYLIQEDEQSGLNITLQTVIDTNSIGFTSPSSMTYFSYTGNDNNLQYKFLFVDKINGLFGFDGQITNGKLTMTTSDYLNLTQEIKAKEQFISSVTQFYQINNYQTPSKSQDNKLTAKVILTTSNVAHFGLSLNFDLPETSFINNIGITVDFTINRYGSAQTLNQLLVNNNLIIIPYQTAANQATFCQYKIPTSQSLNSGLKASSVPTLNILGGQDFYTNIQKQIPMILNNSQSLYSNQESYDIYPNATILVSNSNELQSQNLTLSAYNAQGGKPISASASLIIKPQPQPDPDPDPQPQSDKKSLAWWAILLIVLGVLAAIGFVFMFVKKFKKSSTTKVKEQLLTNSINQDFK